MGKFLLRIGKLRYNLVVKRLGAIDKIETDSDFNIQSRRNSCHSRQAVDVETSIGFFASRDRTPHDSKRNLGGVE